MTILSLIALLVVIPAGIGYCLYIEWLAEEIDPSASLRDSLRRLFNSDLEPGDFLIYRKPKVSPRPGHRARNVQPSEKGDDYYYEVDKYWALDDVLDDGRLVAVTRTGKHVYLAPEDEKIRKAGLVERLRFRGRFPSV